MTLLNDCISATPSIGRHLQHSQHLLKFNVGLIIFLCAVIVGEEAVWDVKSSEQSSDGLRHGITQLFHMYACCSENCAPRMVWLSGLSQSCNHCSLYFNGHSGINECKPNQNFTKIPQMTTEQLNCSLGN